MINASIINDFIILAIWLCLLISCYTDLKYRIISNYIVVTIFTLVLINYILGRGQLNYIASSLFFIFGLIMFYCRLIGGGDVKLITVLLISIPQNSVLFFLVIITIIGLPLAIIALIYKAVTKKNRITLPYGIAISGSYILTSLSMFNVLIR